MSDQNHRYEEDTISLIDLVAVLVRFRKMIVGGTLAVAILAGVYLYSRPTPAVTEGPAEEYTTEQRLSISSIPEDLARYVSLDPAGAVESIVTDPRTVAAAYREVEPMINSDIPEDRSEERYLSMIRSSVIDERLSVSYDRDTSILTLGFTSPDREASERFSELILAELDDALEPIVDAQVERAESVIDSSLDSVQGTVVRAAAEAAQRAGNGIDPEEVTGYLERNASTALQSLADLVSLKERVLLLREDRSLYTRLGVPVTFAEESGGMSTASVGRSTRVVIAVVTAFFLFVFLAFVRQYIHNVRNDEEEMKKLQDAWKGEKPPRP